MPQQALVDQVSGALVGVTSLSSAITAFQLNLNLASATGIDVPSLGSAKVGSFLFCNGEMMQVTGTGPGTAGYRVKRGVQGTPAQAHASGAIVYIGAAATSSGDTSRPFSNFLFTVLNASFNPSMGPVPLSGTNSSAISVSGSVYYSQVDVEFARTAKGIVILNGNVAGGTDNHIVALYDFDGNLIANSALAGTASASPSLLQSIPFVTPVELRGATSYFIAFQSNGNTDTVQKYITGQVPTNFQAGSVTGTFGTLPNPLLVAGTFTTATGPIGGIY